MCFFVLMIRQPPRSTRTDTLFPYTTLFRSLASLLAIGLTGLAVALIVPRVVPERSSSGPVDPEVNPEEIVHLHAVGVNPGDGLPYLATHTGVLTYRSEEHTSELQSLMRISYAVFCLQKKNKNTRLRTN